jgi:hypothetical protein
VIQLISRGYRENKKLGNIALVAPIQVAFLLSTLFWLGTKNTPPQSDGMRLPHRSSGSFSPILRATTDSCSIAYA